MSARIEIVSIGVLAPGLDGWQAARTVLSGGAPFVACDVAPPPSAQLAAAERRRLNNNSRWALAVASEALAGAPDVKRSELSCVFGSADGDGDVLAQTLAALASSPVAMSPTLFHNSVFNAPAGYCSIAHGLTGASTSLCAGEFTFGVALGDACDQVILGGAPVLCVVVDTAYPESLAGMHAVVPSFACALVLRPAGRLARPALGSISLVALPAGDDRDACATPSSQAHCWSGGTMDAALPLLAAIANQVPSAIDIAQPADTAIVLDYQP